MEALVSFVTTHLTGLLSKDAIVFIISLMPILELRGGPRCWACRICVH